MPRNHVVPLKAEIAPLESLKDLLIFIKCHQHFNGPQAGLGVGGEGMAPLPTAGDPHPQIRAPMGAWKHSHSRSGGE